MLRFDTPQSSTFRLPIVRDERRDEVQNTERQACSKCRMLSECWKTDIDAYAKAINLLVCRLKRNINRERTTKVLLEMLKPKILRVAKKMTKALKSSPDGLSSDLVMEVQSRIIETLLTQYHMGEAIHPLHWLFGKPKGAVTMWASRYVSNALRAQNIHTHYGSTGTEEGYTQEQYPSDFEMRLRQINSGVFGGRAISAAPDLESVTTLTQPNEYDTDSDAKEMTSRAREIIEDGVTLPLAEYRVLKFCMNNARDSSAPGRGLRRQFADLTRQQRRSVNFLYRLSKYRLLEALGKSHTHFAKKGVRIPRSARSRRQSWQHRMTQSDPITADEIHDLISLKKSRRVSVAELAWMYGISEDFVYRLQRRFGKMTRQQIHDVCNR